MFSQNVYPFRPAQNGAAALRILRVIPAEPHYGTGTYEVRLQLSRPLTEHERCALHPISRDMHVIRDQLMIYDTTLERVAADAGDLAALMQEVETEGRRLQEDAGRRAREFAEIQAQDAARMSRLAAAIEFPPGYRPVTASCLRHGKRCAPALDVRARAVM